MLKTQKYLEIVNPTGKPDAVKVACPVWRGVLGDVPKGNAPGTYPTPVV
jgi:hypothetical protein